MGIKFTEHAKERIEQRGATEAEVLEVLAKGVEVQAGRHRKAKESVFDYGREWLGKSYPQKKVEVVFVEEGEDVVVITVKVYYGDWR